ncbi:DUF3239 domain-containing protein [Corynebacterium kutscheri]|uniref:DUF3239 domain-containing protein n=1 Tax=Corynebacterium kutscheri TaxID=35755 RepID=UPI0037C01E20
MANFHFVVDKAHAQRNNELLKDTKRLQLSAAIFSFILLAIGAGFYSWLSAIVGIIIFACFTIVALISFILIPVFPRLVGSAQSLYDSYELVPAIITEINPRDMSIMALVDADSTGTNPQPALAVRTISNLAGHNRTVGEKVPSVAVTGNRSAANKQTWDQISPVPIAWGTPEAAIIKAATDAIDPAQWAELEKHLAHYDEVRKTPFDLLLL